MNSRILELITSPDIILEEDLSLLADEISVQPYAQSLRALYLLGIKRFREDEFQKVLSTTAAYTTDKKILYQLINGKSYESTKPETILNSEELSPTGEEGISSLLPIEVDYSIVENAIVDQQKDRALPAAEKVKEGNWLAAIPKPPVPKKVITEGEVNRILFEGEENFLNEEPTERIDLEASAETGVLVSEKIPPVEIEEENLESPTRDLLEKEENSIISSTELPKENAAVLIEGEISSEISNVEIASPEEKAENEKVTAIQAFIESNIIENPVVEYEDKQVNFHDEPTFMPDVNIFSSSLNPKNQSFHYKKEDSIENKYEAERKKLTEEIEQKMALGKFSQTLSKTERTEPADQSHQNSFQNLNNEQKNPEVVIVNTEFHDEKISQENLENSAVGIVQNEATASKIIHQIPELNTNTSSGDVAKLQPKIIETEKTNEKSNVPVFINTWQKWLQIDREPEAIIEEETVLLPDVKTEAIEKFIVAEPKISRFKEEGTFTVQERKDDISHLMTETLAKLFWSQKLYSKAISGYKLLIDKNPEKRAYYETQIKEIKEFRQK